MSKKETRMVEEGLGVLLACADACHTSANPFGDLAQIISS